MPSITTQQAPAAKAEMLIRKPVEDVFEAFINPDITSQFWFSKGSGRLEIGQKVIWYWDKYNLSVTVTVKEIEKNRRICLEWTAYQIPTTVEWQFSSPKKGTTFVSITNSGFQGDRDAQVQQAISSTEGFTLVLAGLKAFLEHNVILNLVWDRFPDKRV